MTPAEALATLYLWLALGAPGPVDCTSWPGAFRVRLLPGNARATVEAHLRWWHGTRPGSLPHDYETRALAWLAERVQPALHRALEASG